MAYNISPEINGFINNSSARYGLDPNVLRGVIGKESSFNPNTPDSATGAIGLGQVLPSTAAQPGYGLTPLSNPRDPQANVDFTARYLVARGSPSAYSGRSYDSVQPIDANGNPIGAPVTSFAGAGGATVPASGYPTTAGGYDAAGAPYSYSTDALGNPIPGQDFSPRPGGPNPNGTLQPGGGNIAGGGVNGYAGLVPGLHDWFRRIAIAIVAIVMLGVALVAISRENVAGQLRKAVS